MPRSIFDPEVQQVISAIQAAAIERKSKTVIVDGTPVPVQYPFPSPTDWRQCWIYFLLLDRFANEAAPPRGETEPDPAERRAWNQVYGKRHGGTFRGVQSQLKYLADLGVSAIWLSPVLKNSKPPEWDFNYHGYGIQDFLSVDERFASDGRVATAEAELAALVDEAHARKMYVILDIVLNHSARVFDYERPQGVVASFADSSVMDAPLGSEPEIEWLNGFGFPRSDWRENIPSGTTLSADDALWPSELRNRLFFRRRGSKLTDKPDSHGFVRGDFDVMRQFVTEYDASTGQEELRARYGIRPVLAILVRAHVYLMAKYDIDGYRIDTVKYVQPDIVRQFGNAIREFGLSAGKHNFFTFGEIYDDEQTIAGFVGRRTGGGEGFGIDAALDFPLFYKLPQVAKGFEAVETIRRVFQDRKSAEEGQLSSHGEAGRYFVTFCDNHDQHQRLQHPSTPPEQVLLALGLLFSLQGIPCVYYGTEQGLSGCIHDDGSPDLNSNESTREALWGKPSPFDPSHPVFQDLRRLSHLRLTESPLTFGRLYFREVSRTNTDFGHSFGKGGLVAFSRILMDREVVVIANTGSNPFNGSVIVDRDINAQPKRMKIVYSNRGSTGSNTTQNLPAAQFSSDTGVSTAAAALLPVNLKASEIQIFAPE